MEAEAKTFAKKAALKELERIVYYNEDARRRNDLEGRIWDWDREYGQGCARCDARQKRVYDEMVAELAEIKARLKGK
jgi:hypothetical protein